jgi:flavin-dependent dehydrogenase
MKLVAILGGGPAGAFAAERLASAGLDTIVFDEKLAWENPAAAASPTRPIILIRS